MAKIRTSYVCSVCGNITSKWFGQCPDCGRWNTLEEAAPEIAPQSASVADKPQKQRGGTGAEALPFSQIESSQEIYQPTGISELDRVLGGGLVEGGLLLFGGEPGIGKSTLLLQVCANLSRLGKRVLYITGEESARQVKLRAHRLGLADTDMLVLAENAMDAIERHLGKIQPDYCVIDSIQTMYRPEMASAPGSVSQIRESASLLMRYAKTSGCAVMLVGHVTKEGNIAGPRILEHIVDTVLYLEGDRFMSLRLLRSVKNRYGATSEVGVFEMLEEGLVEVKNPSEVFLAERMVNAPGSAIVVTMEGTRPLLVEIQGLTNPVGLGNPRRTPIGVDINRLFLITAVLTRRIGVRLGEQDVFVNVVGGMRIAEPAADLAIAAAIVSSARNQPVRADAVLIGEIGLSGELRGANKITARLNEAAKLGFTLAVIPRVNQKTRDSFPKTMQVIEARSLREALRAVLLPENNRD